MTNSAISLGLQTAKETPDPQTLPVTGQIPSYIPSGTLYRNGPGRYEATHKDGKPHIIRHWFDGHALLHAFTIDPTSNTVHYQSRFPSNSALDAIAATNKNNYSTFSFGSADPCQNLFSKFFNLFAKAPVDPNTGLPVRTTPNVTVQKIGGVSDLVARTDANSAMVFDARTLQPVRSLSLEELDDRLQGEMTASHGEFDERTGEFFNYVYTLGPPRVKYSVFSVSPSGKTNVLATFQHAPCYIHSFALTENYVVLCLWPTHLDSLRMLLNKDVLSGMSFDKNTPTTFVVISRSESRIVAKYTSPAFYCFHTINAFEKDNSIHIDLCEYDDMTVIHQFLLQNFRKGTLDAPLRITRYTLPDPEDESASRLASRSVLAETSLEFPQVHPAVNMKPYTYVYGAVSSAQPFSHIAKVNVVSGEVRTWGLPNCVVGEPIFVPDESGVDEDDGALLVVVLDANVQKSMLVVLDARSLTEIARAVVPSIVPLGFHGSFRAD